MEPPRTKWFGHELKTQRREEMAGKKSERKHYRKIEEVGEILSFIDPYKTEILHKEETY
jgi:hypothetical protein